MLNFDFSHSLELPRSSFCTHQLKHIIPLAAHLNILCVLLWTTANNNIDATCNTLPQWQNLFKSFLTCAYNGGDNNTLKRSIEYNKKLKMPDHHYFCLKLIPETKHGLTFSCSVYIPMNRLHASIVSIYIYSIYLLSLAIYGIQMRCVLFLFHSAAAFKRICQYIHCKYTGFSLFYMCF